MDNNKNTKSRVSIYVKGDRNSPDYYRIHQYLDRIDNVVCTYHLMMPPSVYRFFMPVSGQPIGIQLFIALLIYFRMLWAIGKDLFSKPDYIVIFRRITPRFMPLPIRWTLKYLKNKGTRIYWDFDDDILEFKEVRQKDFLFLENLADRIVVTHDTLCQLVSIEHQSKVVILPTTDGDMYTIFREEPINQEREQTLQTCVRIIWLGVSVNLPYLQTVIPILDKAAKRLGETYNKNTELTVVCNKPLCCNTSYLTIRNVVWTKERAVQEMRKAHIGIMPLSDSKAARGKGGFKLVQYLSMGIPCIGSDVGYNKCVITPKCGFIVAAPDSTGWIEAVEKLSDGLLWKQYSKNAYNRWEEAFSFEYNLENWKNWFK